MNTKTSVQFGIDWQEVRRADRNNRLGGAEYDAVERALKVAMVLVKNARVHKVEVSRDGMLFTVTLPDDVDAARYAESVKAQALAEGSKP